MNTKVIFQRLFLASILLTGLALSNPEPKSGVTSPATVFRFDVVGLNEPVEHTFQFVNSGETPLEVTNVVVTSPIVFKSATSKVLPGDEGKLTFYLGTPRVAGDYNGAIRLEFKNPGVQPMDFHVDGRITPAVECVPMPALYIATQRGTSRTASLELVNRDREPLEILSFVAQSQRFTAKIVELERGRRFKLNVEVAADAKAGRLEEKIVLTTSNKKQPTVVIPVNTMIKDRVYTFPDRLDFGAVRAHDLQNNPELLPLVAQVLMIYREAGSGDFEVSAETDIPFLKCSTEVADTKDRCQLHIEIVPEKLGSGYSGGSIKLRTNDPEFPVLEVPVSINVEG
jgi:hypothetical protein